MQIYLPIAEISLNILLLVGIGTAVGFLSGMFGVGGGFLLTPFLIFIGVPPGGPRRRPAQPGGGGAGPPPLRWWDPRSPACSPTGARTTSTSRWDRSCWPAASSARPSAWCCSAS